MNTPNPELMRLFGTQDVYEQKLASPGFAPLAARMLLGLMNVSQTQADSDRERYLLAKAQEMNAALAQARALAMYPAEQRMQHTRVPIALLAGRQHASMMSGDDIPVGMDEGMVRLAAAIGRDLAHLDIDSLEKDAGIGDSFSKVVGAVGTAGSNMLKRRSTMNAASSAARVQSMGQMGLDAGKAVRGLVNNVKAAPTNISNTIGGKIEQVGSKVEGKLNSAFGGTGGSSLKTPQIGGRVKTPEQAPGVQPPKGGQPNIQQPMPSTEPNAGVPGPRPPPQPAQAAPGAPAPTPGPATAGKVGPPEASADPLQSAWNRTGLAGGAWKKKIPMLAAGGLAAYGAVRGAKAISGMMSQESAPYQFNQGSAQPAAGINEYGYADRSTPFTT